MCTGAQQQESGFHVQDAVFIMLDPFGSHAAASYLPNSVLLLHMHQIGLRLQQTLPILSSIVHTPFGISGTPVLHEAVTCACTNSISHPLVMLTSVPGQLLFKAVVMM